MSKVKIAIVDDEILFAEGVSLLFSANNEIDVVNVSNSGPDFLDYLDSCSENNLPHIALVDIQMKPMNGFELVEQLKENYESLKIIILSTHYQNAMFGHMIKLGVSAFLAKNSNKDLLNEAIHSVFRTGVFYTENDHKMLMSYVQSEEKRKKSTSEPLLSDREVQVIQLICEENTTQQIADKLAISKRTVDNHRQRIQDKIGASNSIGLVVYAISHGLFIPKKGVY